MLPIIKTALRILGTVLKTYNRSTMTNDRLNALAMLNFLLDLHPTSKDVLHKFIALGPHRLDFDI